MKINRIAVSLLLILLILLLCSCKNSSNTEESTGYEYIPVGSETTTAAQQTESIKEIKIDNSWKNNYSVSYRYYNPDDFLVTQNITEKRYYDSFIREDDMSLTYYKANGDVIDKYYFFDNEEPTHEAIHNEDYNRLNSVFMKLSSDIDSDFPSLSNVLYMYNEAVSGRTCHKFIQRAYSEGKLTESVYVWIDIQFGFVAKCEVYDKNNELRLMWEIDSFEAGRNEEKDVFIDLSEYEFKEVSVVG